MRCRTATCCISGLPIELEKHVSEFKYYWEDFRPGETAQFGAYLVTREEILEFASEYDPQPIHLDDEAAKKSIVGGLCASGWHSCAMVMRMMCDEYLLDTACLGGLGIEDARWRAPVRPGDILSATRLCVESRASKTRPEVGITNFRHTAINQHGEVKLIIQGPMMLFRRVPGVEA